MNKRRQPSLTPDFKASKNSFLIFSGSNTPVNYHLGVEKLQLYNKNKQLAEEIGLVSNKINVILKLESKTRRNYEKEKKIAEEAFQKKARNELKVKEKETWLELKKKEVEDLRKRNYSDKLKRKLAIRALQNSIIRERLDYAKEVKKNRTELDHIGRTYKQQLKQQKLIMKTNRKKEAIQFKNKSDTITMKFTESLKQAYQDKIAYEKKVYLELLNQKKELEKKEAEVIQNYSKTLITAGINPELISL